MYKNVSEPNNTCGVNYVTATAVFQDNQEMKVILRKTEYDLITFLQHLQARYDIKEKIIAELIDKIDEDCAQRHEESQIE